MAGFGSILEGDEEPTDLTEEAVKLFESKLSELNLENHSEQMQYVLLDRLLARSTSSFKELQQSARFHAASPDLNATARALDMLYSIIEALKFIATNDKKFAKALHGTLEKF